MAAHWVALHPVLDASCPDACFQSPKTLAGEGSPAIDEFCIPDVATMLGLTCDAVGSYLTDIIELRYRLPHLWAGALTGQVTPWRARALFMPDQLAREVADAADRRHVTFSTDQVSYDGTIHLEADVEIADALGLAEAVTDGAARLAALGSEDTLDGRRATALGDLARHQLAFGFPDEAEPPPRHPSR